MINRKLHARLKIRKFSSLVKYISLFCTREFFSTLEEEFCISKQPCDILNIFGVPYGQRYSPLLDLNCTLILVPWKWERMARFPSVGTELQLSPYCSKARLVCTVSRYDHITPSLISLHWLPVTHRIEFKIAMLVHKCIYGVAPQYLLDLIKIKVSSRYQLRSYRGILLMDNSYRTKKTLGDRAFENVAPKVWNKLPLEIRKCQSLNTFKVLLKTHLFKLAFY